jgi:hypothetical protein
MFQNHSIRTFWVRLPGMQCESFASII